MLESALEVVVFCLMEAIHVELANEAVHFVMSEKSGKDYLFEFRDIFDYELCSVRRPIDDLLVVVYLG